MNHREPWGPSGFSCARTRVEDMAWLPLESIAFRMREIDRKEIYGNLPSDNPLYLVTMLMNAVARQGVGWIGFVNERPALWLAMFEQWPGNWQVTSGGTDDYRAGILALMPYFHRAASFAVNQGARRLEARSHCDHPEGRRLAKLFGAVVEGTLTSYGRDGADYYQLAWTGKRLQDAARNVHGSWGMHHDESGQKGEASEEGSEGGQTAQACRAQGKESLI